MRISKNQKANYDTCINFLKQSDLESTETKRNSLSMFGYILNFHDDAKKFSEYCKSIGENKIAKYAVRGWE